MPGWRSATTSRPIFRAIPRAVYTDPEVAGVGLQLDAARDAGHDAFEKSADVATARPRATSPNRVGHVSIVVDRAVRTLVGAFIAGPGAAEAIHLAVLAVKSRTPLEVLADTITAFPDDRTGDGRPVRGRRRAARRRRVTIAPSDASSVPVLPASAVTAISAAQMAEVDRAAIEDFGVTILQMMEQAGSHLAEVVRLELGGHLDERRVVVAVGPGNNGGGGLVAARHLANRGATVRVVLSRPALRMSEPSRHQLATLIAMGAECCVATYDLDDDELVDVLSSADAIVDAILGYHGRGRSWRRGSASSTSSPGRIGR